MSNYRATSSFSVWKQHTCIQCSCKYRYLLRRKKTGAGLTEQAACAAAEANGARAARMEVDPHPCPTCGLYQPDMVAAKRRRLHGYVFLLLLLLYTPAVIVGFATHWTALAPWLFAAAATVACVAHARIELGNPNNQWQANLEIARQRVANDKLFIIQAGDSLQVGAESAEFVWRPAGQIILYGLFLAGLLALPAGELMLLARGWSKNPQWRPELVGPGDEATIDFPTKIRAVGGNWSARVTKAVILNAAELGVAEDLQVISKIDAWGSVVSYKSSSYELEDQAVTVWGRVELPKDANLAGKTLHVQIDLEVTYPKRTKLGITFENVSEDVSLVTDLSVATQPQPGATYVIWYWSGLLGGLIVTLGTSLAIR